MELLQICLKKKPQVQFVRGPILKGSVILPMILNQQLFFDNYFILKYYLKNCKFHKEVDYDYFNGKMGNKDPISGMVRIDSVRSRDSNPSCPSNHLGSERNWRGRF